MTIDDAITITRNRIIFKSAAAISISISHHHHHPAIDHRPLVTMEDDPAIRDTFIKSGYSCNEHGGFYLHGKTKSLEEKAEVARVYVRLKSEDPKTSIRDVAKKALVSYCFARKVVNEVNNGQLVDPKEKAAHRRAKGAGSRTLSLVDECALLELRAQNNQRPLIDYKHRLEEITGTIVSTSTICKWFLYSNMFKGGCRVLNKVPIDKWKPENVERAQAFIQLIYQLDPFRLKFCDEAHIKGQHLHSKNGRRCPVTGVLEPVLVGSDFRNAYSITGFCGIALDTPPFSFVMHKGTNDARKFTEFVLNAVVTGFLRSGDVLIMDNASIHTGCESVALEDVLLADHDIHVLFLPTRSPELNPIEQMWHLLRRRLEAECVKDGNDFSTDHVADVAAGIMNAFTHDDVYACYYHSKYVA